MEGQEITIQDLYDEKATLEIKFKQHDAPFEVEMIYEPSRYGKIAHGKPLAQDCKIGSWSANRFFRTERGESHEAGFCPDLDTLKQEIEEASSERGLTVEAYILKMKEEV